MALKGMVLQKRLATLCAMVPKSLASESESLSDRPGATLGLRLMSESLEM